MMTEFSSPWLDYVRGESAETSRDEACKTSRSPELDPDTPYAGFAGLRVEHFLETQLSYQELLGVARDTDQETGCPPEWRVFPVLPERGTKLEAEALWSQYRVRLFGRHWHLFFRKPEAPHNGVRATDEWGTKWEVPRLHNLVAIALVLHVFTDE